MAPRSWRVPRVKADETNLRLKDQINAAIEPVLFGDWWAAQQLVTELERRFCEEMSYRYTSAVQSGSSGLRLALLACGIKPGDEVITVANSDISTTASISQCGANLVLCDVQRSDHVIDINLVESLITDRTRCILSVDLYGHPVDVPHLREIADRYDLFIIQDACIAVGAMDYDQPIGTFGDITVFSTCAGKPFPSAGHGGLVVTNNHELWKKVETLKGFGRSPEKNFNLPVKYDHIMEGYNLRMTPFDAAILLVKLPYLKEWSEKRRRIGDWYNIRLQGLPGVSLPSFRPESKPIFRTYTICIENRDEAYQYLSERGVHVALNYVPPVHQQTVYKQSNISGSDNLPVTEWLSERLLALPVDPELNEQDIEYVCSQIVDFVNS
jgi:dTDP-4-amino-4,6-dideoxygalactose transaminase